MAADLAWIWLWANEQPARPRHLVEPCPAVICRVGRALQPTAKVETHGELRCNDPPYQDTHLARAARCSSHFRSKLTDLS